MMIESVEKLHDMDENLSKCFELLKSTSRSFYLVTHALPEELSTVVCIFYLVLRGLDTIEDNMDLDILTKRRLLFSFDQNLHISKWSFNQSFCGSNSGNKILSNFHIVIEVFNRLHSKYKSTIIRVVQDMRIGMVEFLDKSIDTLQDYERYSYFVAGLVGIGLSDIWTAFGFNNDLLEQISETKRASLSISMGVFLQKVNIIHDFKEDFDQGRYFWPKEIWSKYVPGLKCLLDHQYKSNALLCLNSLIMNALCHINDILEYLSFIKHDQIFYFCAVPQIIAMATLVTCYNSYHVILGNFEVSNVETVMFKTALDQCYSIQHVRKLFYKLVLRLKSKASQDDLKTLLPIEKDLIRQDPSISYSMDVLIYKYTNILVFVSLMVLSLFMMIACLPLTKWTNGS